MQAVNFVLNTAGDGYWSSAVKSVHVVGLELYTCADDLAEGALPEYGELRVYFDTASWNIRADGLIYTDSEFERGLAINLIAAGLGAEAAGDVGYSEQGMQGSNYVSCDVGEAFVRAWVANAWPYSN